MFHIECLHKTKTLNTPRTPNEHLILKLYYKKIPTNTLKGS